MLRVLSAIPAFLLLAAAQVSDAAAACPYRTTLPGGARTAGWAEELSLACVIDADPGCRGCVPWILHQCIGGRWKALGGGSCGSVETQGVPFHPPARERVDDPRGNRSQARLCTYYDRDGRRISLPPKDLAWAEATGLVAEKSCR